MQVRYRIVRPFQRKTLTVRQKVLLGVAFAAVIALMLSYILAFMGKDPCETLTTAVLGVFGTAFASYMVCDTADHNSANKYGIEFQEPEENDEGDV